MKTGVPETAIHTSYLPWLAKVDALVGTPTRLDLAKHTSFIAAWQDGLSPHEAVAGIERRIAATMTAVAVRGNRSQPRLRARRQGFQFWRSRLVPLNQLGDYNATTRSSNERGFRSRKSSYWTTPFQRWTTFTRPTLE